MNQNVTTEIVCQKLDAYRSIQFMQGGKIYRFRFPPVLLQIVLVTVFKTIFQFLLRPFGQQSFVSDMLGGIAISPSFLGQVKSINEHLVAPQNVMVLDTFEDIGFIFFVFLLSIRLDLTILKKCGKLAVVAGLASFVVPVVITLLMASLLRGAFELDQEPHLDVHLLALLISTTSFHVIFSILADLKLLNSELGRLALSSSMISGWLSWLVVVGWVSFKGISKYGSKGVLFSEASRIVMVVIIVYAFRPIMFWMIRRTPEGKPLKQSYIWSISTMVLLSALLGEVTGFHFLFGPIILGLATPSSPLLCSCLMEKLGSFVDALLMPCYIIHISRQINLFLTKFKQVVFVQILVFICSLSKAAAVIVPSIYHKMPFVDALSFSLILNCKGFFDIQVYSMASKFKLTNECFGILVVTSVLQSAVVTLLLRLFYDPSRRYIAYKRRTIQHTGLGSELQILVCLHQEDDVPPIISVLEASSPTRESPIAVYAMKLKKLLEGTFPLFISHKLNSRKSDRVSNAFSQFEQQNRGLVTVQCFTSFAPYATMHDDVCTMALEKSASLVIIPFRHSDSPSIRTVNRNILEKAPCSVAILFDRGNLERSLFSGRFTMKVCVVFVGGADDRETLAYAQRMSLHPSIRLTLLRLVSTNQSITDLIEKTRDSHMVNEFRLNNECPLVTYKEEMIEQGLDTVRLLGAMCNDYELIMVGRRHDPDSSPLMGLSDWGEVDQDLGVIGDLVASEDFGCKASILVLQQQASVVKGMIQSRKHIHISNSDMSNSTMLPAVRVDIY